MEIPFVQVQMRRGPIAEHLRDLSTIQDHRCAICGGSGDPIAPLVLDHDHVTGLVRGWLCRNCNAWLGHHIDNRHDEKFLRSVLTYLKEPPVRFLDNHPLLTERRLRCSRCKLERPLTEFYRFRRGGVLRFAGYCKNCMREYQYQRRLAKEEQDFDDPS